MQSSVNLIIQYCNSTNPARQAEYDFCVLANLNNPHIRRIYNLVESKTQVPAVIREHSKYSEHPAEHWLTYEAAFKFANEVIGPDQFCCISNLDIFLDKDSDWTAAHGFLKQNNKTILCLSRHEFDGVNKAELDRTFSQLCFANTQDAWLFLTPIAVDNCDFELGQLGCDNAIAHRIKQSGYFPVNMPIQYKIFHYDLCRKEVGQTERYQSQATRVQNKYPEIEGQFLLPAFDLCRSVDQVLDAVHASPLQRYQIICEVFSKFVRIKNP